MSLSGVSSSTTAVDTATAAPSAVPAELGTGVHLMPFATTYSGPAPVNRYLKTTRSSARSGTEVLTSHFRGRCIKGTQIALPSHVAGVLIASQGGAAAGGGSGSGGAQQTHQAPTRSSEPLVAAGAFSALTVWEHDVEPSTAPIDGILDYIDLARAVHEI